MGTSRPKSLTSLFFWVPVSLAEWLNHRRGFADPVLLPTRRPTVEFQTCASKCHEVGRVGERVYLWDEGAGGRSRGSGRKPSAFDHKTVAKSQSPAEDRRSKTDDAATDHEHIGPTLYLRKCPRIQTCQVGCVDQGLPQRSVHARAETKAAFPSGEIHPPQAWLNLLATQITKVQRATVPLCSTCRRKR